MEIILIFRLKLPGSGRKAFDTLSQSDRFDLRYCDRTGAGNPPNLRIKPITEIFHFLTLNLFSEPVAKCISDVLLTLLFFGRWYRPEPAARSLPEPRSVFPGFRIQPTAPGGGKLAESAPAITPDSGPRSNPASDTRSCDRLDRRSTLPFRPVGRDSLGKAAGEEEDAREWKVVVMSGNTP